MSPTNWFVLLTKNFYEGIAFEMNILSKWICYKHVYGEHTFSYVPCTPALYKVTSIVSHKTSYSLNFTYMLQFKLYLHGPLYGNHGWVTSPFGLDSKIQILDKNNL